MSAELAVCLIEIQPKLAHFKLVQYSMGSHGWIRWMAELGGERSGPVGFLKLYSTRVYEEF